MTHPTREQAEADMVTVAAAAEAYAAHHSAVIKWDDENPEKGDSE